MMEDPRIAGERPEVVNLKPGTYWWCACGHSKKQPWCDGSHKGTEFSPVEVNITEEKNYGMCMCKRSERGPFCDGTHKVL